MTRISQSPCSDELDSVTSSSGPEVVPPTKQPIKIEDKENIDVEQPVEVSFSAGIKDIRYS